MSVWGIYEDRVNAKGATKRDVAIGREVRLLNRRVPDNPSFQHVTIFDQEHGYNVDLDGDNPGEFRRVSIINSDNYNEKTIIGLPGEDIEHGSLVYWMDNYWLVTERDVNTTIYTRAKMTQCNYLLRWVAHDMSICEQWCIIEDGTKLKRRMRDSLAYRKRYVKTIPLTAGNSLEPCHQNGAANSRERQRLKTARIGQSAAKSRRGKGSTTMQVAAVGASAPKRGTPKPYGMAKI